MHSSSDAEALPTARIGVPATSGLASPSRGIRPTISSFASEEEEEDRDLAGEDQRVSGESEKTKEQVDVLAVVEMQLSAMSLHRQGGTTEISERPPAVLGSAALGLFSRTPPAESYTFSKRPPCESGMFSKPCAKRPKLMASPHPFVYDGSIAVPMTAAHVVVSETLRDIPSNAFRDRPLLRSVVLPRGLLSIGYSAFCGCSSLVDMKIPSGVTEIGVSAFAGTALREMVLPPATMGISAFVGCKSLARIEIRDGVTALPFLAFGGCDALAEVSIPSSVEIIGNRAFHRCKGLRAIRLHEGLLEIGGFAFGACDALGSAVVPRSVTKLSPEAFGNDSHCTVRRAQDSLWDWVHWCLSTGKLG